MKLFADDTFTDLKIYRTRDNTSSIREDLNTLPAFSDTWLLRFSASKCMLLRKENSSNQYNTIENLKTVNIENIQHEKDSGLIFYCDF